MAIITGGYDGTVDEVQFAALLHRYSVVGPDDLKATTQAGDRIVSIGNGTALGPGTVDVASNLPTIQFNAATGTRWDLVVLRRDWQPPGGVSSIVIIEGGTTQAYPTIGTATNQWNRRPGIMDDQPLYLQQVNGTLLGNRIDLRVWGSLHTGYVANDPMVKTYLDRVGTEVRVAGERWTYDLGANNVPQWNSDAPVIHAPVAATNWSATGDITVQPAGTKRQVTFDVVVKRTGPAFTLDSGAWEYIMPLIPAAIQKGAGAKYPPILITGGTNHILAAALVNPNGGLSIRSTSGSYPFTTGALFTLNFSYYI